MTASDIFTGTLAFIFALLLLGGMVTLIKLVASWLHTRWRMVKYRIKGRR